MDADEKRWRVLYVSDRDTDPFRAALESNDDLAILTAGGTEEGRNRLSTGIDCVVCYHNNALDGIGFLETVRVERPNCPFVLVADDDAPTVAGRAVAADVTEFVPRSSSVAVFEKRLAAALAQADGERSDSMRIEGLSIAAELRLKERTMDEAPVGITVSDPDERDNPLVYINDRFEELTGYSPGEMRGRNCRILQGDGTDPETVAELREAIDAASPVTVELLNYRKDGTPFWNEVTVAPLRDDEGAVTHYVGFQSDVTERKEAEFALEAERAAFEHLLNRLDGLLQDVTKDLVEATSRETVEAATCGHLADLEAYPLAWVGRHDLVRDAIVPVAKAATRPVADDALTIDLDAQSNSPVARAYESGATRIATDEAALGTASRFDGFGVEGVAAIPLVYGETTYGVLVLWTTDVEGLIDHEITVFEALARMAATAINAIERGRIIGTDSVVELEIVLTDPDLFFVALSERAACRLEFLGAVAREESMGLFFSTDAPPEAIEAHAANPPAVKSVNRISEGEEDRYEFVVEEPSIVSLLARRGVKIREITAEGGRACLRIELPAESDAREVFELLESRYSGGELVGRRERERPERTDRASMRELEERLTDRQSTALHVAFISGFYDPDRQVTGDELAATMDISRSTYHQHLRAAERKVIEAFFDPPSTLS